MRAHETRVGQSLMTEPKHGSLFESGGSGQVTSGLLSSSSEGRSTEQAQKGSLSGDGGSGQVPSGLQPSGLRGGAYEVRGADLVPSVARTDVPGERASSVEMSVQTEPTFQLLEPGPAHVIIRNNVVPVNPVFLAPGDEQSISAGIVGA